MPFLSEEFVVAAVAVIMFVVIHLMLWSKVIDLKGDIDLLERQLKDKANKWELELTDRTKQLHNEKLEALEAHLGIRFVEPPKRLVVKNILEK
jgi:hypothetical protein